MPLTTKSRPSPTFVALEPSPENGLERPSWAITNQIFTLDKGDLRDPLGKVSKADLFRIKQGVKIALAIE